MSPAGVLATTLRDLHVRAGRPSLRTIARAVGGISHMTVSDALKGRRVPSWDTVRRIGLYLSGDEETLHFQWVAATSEEDLLGGTGGEYLRQYRQQLLRLYEKLPTFTDLPSGAWVRFGEIYVVPKLRIFSATGDETVPVLDLEHFYEQLSHAVLLGSPGAGKTTALIAITRLSASRDDGLVPFLIPLRSFATEVPPARSVVSFIEHQLDTVMQLPAQEGFIQQILSKHPCIILFDGLDEISREVHRAMIVSIIELFCAQYPLARVIVTSRRQGYANIPLDRELFSTYGILEFDYSDLSEYVHDWFSLIAPNDPQRSKDLAEDFIKQSSRLPELRTNPLLLSKMCEQFAYNKNIPHNRVDLFGKLSSFSFSKWDQIRGITTPALIDINLGVLQFIAFRILDRHDQVQGEATEGELLTWATQYLLTNRFDNWGEAEETARKLISAVTERSMLFQEVGIDADGRPIYSFAHRAFLEYFAATHLARQSHELPTLAHEIVARLTHPNWRTALQLAIEIADRQTEMGATNIARTLIEHYNQQGMSSQEQQALHTLLAGTNSLTSFPSVLQDSIEQLSHAEKNTLEG